ncbi:hypothetical protein C477_00075 [Haloterrigena salina JCM 13891]|uniref:Uncharacterized protein n=1 Tax=Haloterrigena salina JCM 13891 TaxID=1227488 RepID=M0CMV8_9EURY|nr:hypothetical protein C477_00075 [Haloterrigena salina JCM 13891]
MVVALDEQFVEHQPEALFGSRHFDLVDRIRESIEDVVQERREQVFLGVVVGVDPAIDSCIRRQSVTS